MENTNQIKLSAIIPIYNEEKVVAQVISELKNQLESLNIEYEIIAVNDSSTDKSKEILEKIGGIKLINHSRNKGYGASLKTGIKNSQYDWILITDADGTYPISAIPQLLNKTDKYDLIIGSREKKGNVIPIERKFAKKFLNKFASYLAGYKIPDLNSGLRIFKKDIVLKYWELFPERFSFTSTLTMACLVHNYNTVFVPIDYYKREGKSSIKSTDFLNFLKLVTKLSLFFKPIKVFVPISLLLLLAALLLVVAFFTGLTSKFLDTTFIVLCATALQTFFFGLLAEIVIHNK
jgi:glycosyltransferase involved in cell wall biosynthesis